MAGFLIFAANGRGCSSVAPYKGGATLRYSLRSPFRSVAKRSSATDCYRVLRRALRNINKIPAERQRREDEARERARKEAENAAFRAAQDRAKAALKAAKPEEAQPWDSLTWQVQFKLTSAAQQSPKELQETIAALGAVAASGASSDGAG